MDTKGILETWAKSSFDDQTLKELKIQHSSVKELDLAEKIIKESNLLKVEFKKSNSDIWDEIIGSIVTDNKPKIIPFYKTNVFWAAASIIILVFTTFMWQILNPELTTYSTSYAQLESIPLPDGSIIRLNANSEVSFDESIWEKERSIQLEGEAFFIVEKGSPFTVKTSKGKIRVLGTSFNVKSRDSIFTVRCKTGRVSVQHKEETKELSPGESVRLRNDSLITTYRNPEQIGAWFIGTFYFDNVSLTEVLAEIEHQFDVNITTKGTSTSLQYQGFFRNNDLEDALKSICLPLNLKYTIDQKKKKVEIHL